MVKLPLEMIKKLCKILLFLVVLMIFPSCTDEMVSFEKHEIVLKKDNLIADIDDFEFTENGLEVFRDYDQMPMGNYEYEVRLADDKFSYFLKWKDKVLYNEASSGSSFSLREIDLITLSNSKLKKDSCILPGTNVFNEFLDSLPKLISKSRNKKLVFYYSLPTFCSEYFRTDIKSGTMDYKIQHLTSIDNSTAEQNNRKIRNSYILLSDIIFCDFFNRGIIRYDDTVIVTKKYSNKSVKMSLKDDRLERILDCTELGNVP